MNHHAVPSPLDHIRSIAGNLNQDCACFSLDMDALHQSLHADSVLSAWWPHWQDTHAHLFAASGLFVSQTQLTAMQEAVKVLHEVMTSPAWRQHALAAEPALQRAGPRGVFMGYDFHLTESGPKLIEINTNAGGAMLNLALTRAQRACCDAARDWMHTATDVTQLEQRWLDMFAQEWALQRPQEPFIPLQGRARTLAIVDEDPASQYLYPEFLLFQDLFRQAGVDARVLTPQDLSWVDGQLQHAGEPIDMVYLRLTDFDLSQPAHVALQQAWASDACVFTPNPQTHALHANKRHLATLSDAPFVAQLGLQPQALSVLASVVPPTQLLTPDNAERLWAERKRYFFKPLSGFGSKAAYRGDKLTTKTWAQISQLPYVAQALIPPSQRVVMVNDQRKTLKVDVRAYAYNGQVQLFAARLYDGQTTNFRSDGGGFAPVFVTPT
ncbi:hypothetical protein [Limnohabitans radicicola]|uniref:Uncharacterized protein n=1 Tax=Limnohabitans radicicola TaxID=2771427 RepID=A0A927IMW1_9BURK|nr:hypothetical protein [Limnohabitans radicicola]MBD8051606.1 hypothetical protein [Limnohabitans radicicola]